MSDPWEVVTRYEASIPDLDRRRRGAWYTPKTVVEELCRRSLEGLAQPPTLIVDPTCGAGGFLLGILDRLVATGLSAESAIERVAGVDIDAGSVGAATETLARWCELHGLSAADANRARLVVADALSIGASTSDWARPDLIVGNPPFATPLKQGALPPSALEVRQAQADVLGPYADLATVHLWNAIRWCADGGRVCLVLPQSVLTSRDAEPLRERLAAEAVTRDLWTSDQLLFDASVRVFAPVLERRPPNGALRSWADLAAEAAGVPDVDGIDEGAATLGSRVETTAGFRDEFYGVGALAREDPASGSAEFGSGSSIMRLATSGSLDPLHLRWGRRPTKLDGRSWDRPTIDLSLADPPLRRWLDRQRQPKVLLPTQTRIFEPVLDPDGDYVGVTPVISVFAARAELGLVAAVLLAPPVVAWAQRRWRGSALSAEALRPSARRLLNIPLPTNQPEWQDAAQLVAAVDPLVGPTGAELDEIARLMTLAYGFDPAPTTPLMNWWNDRAKRRRRAP